MKLFKTTDEKLADIGFTKVKEDKYGAHYSRRNIKHNYTQIIELGHKASGYHLCHSYDKDLFDSKLIGNTNVGLTMYEMKLFYKKMKEMGWKPIKKKQEQYNEN